MNSDTCIHHRPAWRSHYFPLLLVLFSFCFVIRTQAQSLGERVDAATESAKTAVEDAGRTAATKIEQLWAKLDSARLKNRTRDEIVAWAIMGLLVGGLLNRVAGLNALGALGLGLLGAFIGGIIVKLAELDFGFGPVLIRYEDLLISLLGAVLIILLAKMILGRRKSKAKA